MIYLTPTDPAAQPVSAVAREEDNMKDMKKTIQAGYLLIKVPIHTLFDRDQIIVLNDLRRWSREQVTDWFETRGGSNDLPDTN